MRQKLLSLRILFVSMLVLSFLSAFAANQQKKDGYTVEFDQVRPDEFVLDFDLDKFRIDENELGGTVYSSITFNGEIRTKKKGWASLPVLSSSVQLSPSNNVSYIVVNSDYEEYNLDYPLVPSRGVIYRNQDPTEIPYEIDPASVFD